MQSKKVKAARLLSDASPVAARGGFEHDSSANTKMEKNSGWNLSVTESTSPLQLHLQALINNAAEGGPSVSDFLLRLDASGVNISVNIAKTRRISGISYAFGGTLVRGNDLGKAYSWTGIQKHLGVSYDDARDFAVLEKKRGEAVLPNVAADATAAPPDLAKLISLMTALDNDAHDLLDQAVQERQLAAKKVEMALDDAKRHAVNAISQVAAQSERAMQTIIAASKTIDTAALRMKQEVFWIAIIVALVAGLGSALVTGLLMSQQTEKQLQRFYQGINPPATSKQENGAGKASEKTQVIPSK